MAKKLIDFSPFRGQNATDLIRCPALPELVPEDVCDVGFPMISGQRIRFVIALKTNELRRDTSKQSLPVEWQIVAVAKLLAWSRLEPNTLPCPNIGETVSALEKLGEKLVKEYAKDQVPTDKANWLFKAYKYLKLYATNDTTHDNDDGMAWFSNWEQLPRKALTSSSGSSSNSDASSTVGTEPSAKKIKLNLPAGATSNDPLSDNPVWKKHTDMGKALRDLLTTNESLSASNAEKVAGLADLHKEIQRLQALVNEKDKALDIVRSTLFPSLVPAQHPQQ